MRPSAAIAISASMDLAALMRGGKEVLQPILDHLPDG